MSLIAFVVPFYGAATIVAQLGGQSSVQASLQRVTGPVLWPEHESYFFVMKQVKSSCPKLSGS